MKPFDSIQALISRVRRRLEAFCDDRRSLFIGTVVILLNNIVHGLPFHRQVHWNEDRQLVRTTIMVPSEASEVGPSRNLVMWGSVNKKVIRIEATTAN